MRKISDVIFKGRTAIAIIIFSLITCTGFSQTCHIIDGSFENGYFSRTLNGGDRSISTDTLNPADTIVTKGLKDIKSTMQVGWCLTDGATRTYFSTPEVKALSLSNCNTSTLLCVPWETWANTKYVYNVDIFNNQVKELKSRNIQVTSTLLMGQDLYYPDWYTNSDFAIDTLENMMKNWIKSIITYKGNDSLVDNWTVVNEAISWDGHGGYWPINGPSKAACEWERMGFEPDSSGLPSDMVVNSQHPVYIRKTFQEARKYTNKKLELRESNFEFPTDQKYKAFYQLVVHLLKLGTPLDAVSFQTHLNLENIYDWVGYTNNIKRYRTLGLNVNISEVDIGDVNKSWSDEKAQLQKNMYYQLVTAAIRGGANQFQLWGFIDDNNPGWRPGEHGLIFTNNIVLGIGHNRKQFNARCDELP